MTSVGHNSGDETGGVAADSLRSFVSRVERLQDEIDALNADKSEVFKEVKAMGFDVPAIKVVLAERRKQSKDPQKFAEVSEIADLYRSIVGSGAPRVRVHEEAAE